MFPGGVALHNWAVEYIMAAFSELSFTVHWQGRLRSSGVSAIQGLLKY